MRALVAAVLLVSAVASADPVSRLAVTGGRRTTFGRVGETWSSGWTRGVEAGYQPTWVGVAWALLWTTLAPEAEVPISTEVDLWQIDVAARFRARLPLGLPAQTFLYTQLGGTLMRSNIPLTDDGGAGSFGAIAGAGFEVAIGGVQIGLGLGGEVHPGGPSSLDVRLSIGYGRVTR
jgi:hypothetical protein